MRLLPSLIVVLILSAVLCLVSAKELPSQFKLCKLNDPDQLKCILEGINTGIAEISKGIPELGVEPQEIIKIDSFVVGDDGGLKQSYKNIEIVGFKDAKVLTLKGGPDKCLWSGKFYSPRIEMRGDYTVVGKVLILPVNGEGKANATMLDVPGHVKIQCERFEKDSETYVKFTSISFRLQPKQAILDYTNLFKGNPEISENLNKFINENWKDIFQELLPGYEKTMGIELTKIANKVIDGIPYKKLLV